jgi:PDDEXK-like uncharacterized protein DUF3799
MTAPAPAIPTRVTAPGIYTMPHQDYHADPAPVPSLSRSIGKLIIEASPLHAYVSHPRLGGAPPAGIASGDEDMDVGTVAHALFLEGEDRIALVPFDTYQTKAAKELRDTARAEGKIPLKAKQAERVYRVVDALEAFRQQTKLFTAGKPEQTVVWDEGDHWARCRIDWLPDDSAAPILDLKTTGGLAATNTWERQAFQFGADMQASMYPRGLEFVRGEPPDGVLFVVAETDPPYAVRVFGMDPIALEVGASKMATARAIWSQCMKADAWPGYPPGIEYLMPPSWTVRQWETARTVIGRATEDTAFIQRMIEAGQWGG